MHHLRGKLGWGLVICSHFDFLPRNKKVTFHAEIILVS